MRFLEKHPFAFLLALLLVTVMSELTIAQEAVPPANLTPSAETKPVAIFGEYNCSGWQGVLVVMDNGDSVEVTMRPAEAAVFAKKAGIPESHQKHLFPAQGECAKEAPYNQELRGSNT